jgi:hypothetical protein
MPMNRLMLNTEAEALHLWDELNLFAVYALSVIDVVNPIAMRKWRSGTARPDEDEAAVSSVEALCDFQAAAVGQMRRCLKVSDEILSLGLNHATSSTARAQRNAHAVAYEVMRISEILMKALHEGISPRAQGDPL